MTDMSDVRNAELAEAISENTQLKTWHAAEQALRVAAEQAMIEGEKAKAYWYRRTMFAEGLLREAFPYTGEQSKGANYFVNPQTVDAIQLHFTHIAEDPTPRLDDNYEDMIRDLRQKNVLQWAQDAFGGPGLPDIGDPVERALRFLEEAVELWQAVLLTAAGDYGSDNNIEPHLQLKATHEWLIEKTTQGERLYQYVMDRPSGEIRQEIGGVMVTLLSLGEAVNESVSRAEKDEFARVISRSRDHWGDRWAAKREAGF